MLVKCLCDIHFLIYQLFLCHSDVYLLPTCRLCCIKLRSYRLYISLWCFIFILHAVDLLSVFNLACLWIYVCGRTISLVLLFLLLSDTSFHGNIKLYILRSIKWTHFSIMDQPFKQVTFFGKNSETENILGHTITFFSQPPYY